MKKIKNCIIHLFGGYTKEEFNENFHTGEQFCAIDVKTYMDLLYGTPADEWCYLAYEFVKNKAE